MAKELTEKQKKINMAVSRYFKIQGISHKDAAERLGYASKQIVDNQLSKGVFGKRVAPKWAMEFGFNEEFLLKGHGQLIEKPTGYKKIVAENEQLKAIVRIQRRLLEQRACAV